MQFAAALMQLQLQMSGYFMSQGTACSRTHTAWACQCSFTLITWRYKLLVAIFQPRFDRCLQEKQCRFCKQDLPPWKAAFAALSQQPEASHVPVMSIQFNGQKYWLEVRPGVGGVEQFKDDVRKLLGLHPEQAFDITFECRVPIPLAGEGG